MTKVDQINHDPFPSGKLHSGNKIGISGNKDNFANDLFTCQPGNVQPDFDVHFFLIQVRGYISGFQSSSIPNPLYDLTRLSGRYSPSVV